MTHEHGDLRVRRTQKMLQEALLELLAERSFEAISVGDIADRAMVNRATFYRHYQDKYELMEKIFAQVLEQMVQSIGYPRYPLTAINLSKPSIHWVKMFEHVGQNHKLYEAVLGPRGNPLLVARMRDQIATAARGREELREKVRVEQGYGGQKGNGTEIPRDFVLTSVANVLLGSISWWLETGRIYSPEEMASWVLNFVAPGYLYTLDHSLPESSVIISAAKHLE